LVVRLSVAGEWKQFELKKELTDDGAATDFSEEDEPANGLYL
jgi:hypothetical protein